MRAAGVEVVVALHASAAQHPGELLKLQSGAKRRSFGPHLPIGGGQVRLHDLTSAWRAESLMRGEELRASLDGNDLVIDLPPLELFEGVYVRPDGPAG